MAYVNAKNIKLYYEDTGQGEPVVFIHGGFARGDSAFAAQIPAFSRDYRVICPDLRGHGRTIAASPYWETPQLADDIMALLDELHIPKAHFVGHSMGGDVVMYCAILHPERVATATSIASTGVASEEVKKYVREFDFKNLCRERHKRFIERMRSDHALAHNGDLEQFITETVKNCERYPDFLEAELACISMPFLLIYGDADPTIGFGEIAKLKNNIRSFTACAVKDGDHHLHMPRRQGEAVNKILFDFLALNKCPGFSG